VVTTLKNSSVTKWTWTGARFVRESPSEKQAVVPKSMLVIYRARFYDTSTGEFISRDPLEYVDGMSLYRGYFVPKKTDPNGLEVVDTDFIGPLLPGDRRRCKPPIGKAKGWCDRMSCYWFTTKGFIIASEWCTCLTWHEKQCKRGYVWLSTLPACPCSLTIINGTPATPGQSEVGMPTWLPPSKPIPGIEKPGHPNATWCMRSSANASGHGQQCCYDDKGALITGGKSAGTPDYVSPSVSKIGHFKADVDAYNNCKSRGATWIYIQHRPPNNGNNCPANEK
jgi:RHS repeat-associated protein